MTKRQTEATYRIAPAVTLNLCTKAGKATPTVALMTMLSNDTNFAVKTVVQICPPTPLARPINTISPS